MPQNKIKKCLEEGAKGDERHQGLRRVSPNDELAKKHLTKALHNLEAMTALHDLHYSDWSASTAFYTIYHGLLAVLARYGYESRNQFCTLSLIEEFIKEGKLKHLTLTDVKEIFDKNTDQDLEHSSKILDIRERMQYSVKTSLAEEEFQLLKKRTKALFDKIRLDLEEE
ncbi:MAG TPA: HEPN domain-containing protein [Candidatus Nanoarchaeia archaeon]|nr:HEPN domain-containing protein [Candidatus Nanoarchaeia archaeon]